MNVAVLIAVEKSLDARVGEAPFAAQDARELAAVWEQHGFAAVDRLVLVNDEATKAGVHSRVKRLLKGLGEEDQLFLYFAGQGFVVGGKHYLGCYDTSLADLPETSWELDGLFQLLRQSDCQKIALYFDLKSIHNDDSTTATVAADDFYRLPLEALLATSREVAFFAACQPAEQSLASGTLQRGIWAYHLCEAFAGKQPNAADPEGMLTATSLQKALAEAVGSTLLTTFASAAKQTPWSACNCTNSFALTDLAALSSANAPRLPSVEQFKQITLLAERAKGVRTLSGFNKKIHKEPDRAGEWAERFVAEIASSEIKSDIERVFAGLKSAFRLKRTALHSTAAGDGTASIITPYFHYSITVALDPADTSQVIFRRMIDAVKEPKQLLSEEFAQVFANDFDTLEFSTPRGIDLPAFIDRLEDLADPRIRLEYDPETTYCQLQIRGIAGIVMVTPRTISIVHAGGGCAARLFESFLGFQRLLRDEQGMDLLPWGM